MLPDVCSGITIEEIETLDALEALRREWSALWGRSPNATPFQSPEWLLPWWRHIGGQGLRTLALRRDGRLVGLAPLFTYTHEHSGLSQMTLVGNGISDHQDLLLDPEVGADGAAKVLAYLSENGASWDVGDFRDLPASSPLLTTPVPCGLVDCVDAEEPCPVLSLPRSPCELETAIPATLLAKMRYCRRRAERMGEVRIDAVGAGELDDAFESLLSFHRDRWRARGASSVLDAPGAALFHRDAMCGLMARGWLRVYLLRVARRIAAVYYGFLAKRRAYYYLGGFAAAFDAVSPGHLIVLHALTEAVREGARELDFLRGREPYKYAWGAKDRPQYRRRLRHA
jgi:CelD/BcsL family acetyltransferase involved in cellulose biosynthesis